MIETDDVLGMKGYFLRKNIARKLSNNRLLQIKFHTLRHWHATKLYPETRDIYFVQRRLGHRSITNTMRYIQLSDNYFGAEDDEYITQVAETIEQALPLIELGYTEAADYDGVKIYYEKEGKGPPLMLHSGLTGTQENYRDFGYVKPLREKNTLILMDARGHGKSDKPHAPEAYKLKTMVLDTITILDKLEIEKANFMGFSYGGRIGLGIAVYTPERFKSLIIGGYGAIETDSEEEKERIKEERPFYQLDAEKKAQMLIEMGMSESDAKSRAYNTDWEAIYAIRKNVEHIGFQEILPSVNIPSMFFAGTDDYFYPKAKMTSELMKNSFFESIEGLNHAISFRRSQLILPQILDFLAKHNP